MNERLSSSCLLKSHKILHHNPFQSLFLLLNHKGKTTDGLFPYPTIKNVGRVSNFRAPVDVYFNGSVCRHVYFNGSVCRRAGESEIDRERDRQTDREDNYDNYDAVMWMTAIEIRARQ